MKCRKCKSELVLLRAQDYYKRGPFNKVVIEYFCEECGILWQYEPAKILSLKKRKKENE